MRTRLIRTLVEDERQYDARREKKATLDSLMDQVLEDEPTAEGAITLVLSITGKMELEVRTGFRLRRTPSALTKTDLVRALRSAANSLESDKS